MAIAVTSHQLQLLYPSRQGPGAASGGPGSTVDTATALLCADTVDLAACRAL